LFNDAVSSSVYTASSGRILCAGIAQSV
jgi:hypothetical protein